jgi:hypothetical protein
MLVSYRNTTWNYSPEELDLNLYRRGNLKFCAHLLLLIHIYTCEYDEANLEKSMKNESSFMQTRATINKEVIKLNYLKNFYFKPPNLIETYH